MPHRAQRRRNQEAREAPARAAAELEAIFDFAENKLAMRRDFVAEAIRSKGLVSLTLNPRGDTDYVDVYGGEITTDGTSKLHGDGIVNEWSLPVIQGFRVRFSKNGALVSRLEPTFTAIDVSDSWLRTADEMLHPEALVSRDGGEEHITVTRDGLTILSKTIGHNALANGLQYIDSQLFAASDY